MKGVVNLSNINHPNHYNSGSIEVIDYIEDKDFNFNLGNAVKYISRAGRKCEDTYVEDLQKAKWYIQREIQRVSKINEDNNKF